MVPPGFRKNAISSPIIPVFQAPVIRMVEPAQNPLKAIGSWFLYGYIFIALSRILDVTMSGLRVAGVLYVGLIVIALLSGGLFDIFRSRVGIILTLLFVWCSLSVPFSTWRGGSVMQFEEVAKAFFLAMGIIAIPNTVKEVLRLQRTVAIAITTAAILSWFYGRLDYGRLIMNIGTYADPNQFAMTLLIAIPLLLVMVGQAKSIFGRFLWLMCLIPVMIAFLRTGSRGALLGAGAVFVVAFLLVSAKQKLLLVAGTVVVAGLSLVVLPSYVLARFLTFFSASQTVTTGLTEEESQQLNSADVASTAARWSLLMDSIAITLEHPILGVGIGQFPEQNWQRKLKQGNPFANHSAVVTHNIYTQFSSEAGIPALLFFVALLIQCFLSCGKIIKLSPEMASSAGGLRLALVALATCGFFLAVAYSQLFYIMGSIIARMYMTALKTRSQVKAPAAVATPAIRRY